MSENQSALALGMLVALVGLMFLVIVCLDGITQRATRIEERWDALKHEAPEQRLEELKRRVDALERGGK